MCPERLNGKFVQPNRVTEQIWQQFQDEHPDKVDFYSQIPLSLVVERKKDDALERRQNTSLIGFARRYCSLGEAGSSLKAMSKQLGLSSAGVHVLAEATLAVLSEETGFLLPHLSGKGIKSELERINKVVAEYKTLRAKLGQAGELSGLQEAIVTQYLKGYSHEQIAGLVKKEAKLPGQFESAQVTHVVQNLLGKTDYNYPARLAQRGLKAREILVAEKAGVYQNRKAEVTEQILYLLSQGHLSKETAVELELVGNQYSALVSEAHIELASDKHTQVEYAKICSSAIAGWQVGDKLPTVKKVRISRELNDLYKSYRRSLGDSLDKSGWLIPRVLSDREKAVLDGLVSGVNVRALAKKLDTDRAYMSVVADFLLEETDVVSKAELLHERQRMHITIQEALLRGDTLPQKVSSLDGYPVEFFLKSLASEKTFAEISREIQQSHGKMILPAKLGFWLVKIRAFCKRVGKNND